MPPVSHPVARVLPLLTPAHLDRDFDYLVPPELDEIARPGVRVRVRFAGRLVDGYLLSRHTGSDHPGKLVRLERVVSPEQVLTPEILRLATTVAARCAGTRADVLRLAIPPRHARVENGGAGKNESGGAIRAVPPTGAGRATAVGPAAGGAGASGSGRGAEVAGAPAEQPFPGNTRPHPCPDPPAPPLDSEPGRDDSDRAPIIADDAGAGVEEPAAAGNRQPAQDDTGRVSEGGFSSVAEGEALGESGETPGGDRRAEAGGGRVSEDGFSSVGGVDVPGRVGDVVAVDRRAAADSGRTPENSRPLAGGARMLSAGVRPDAGLSSPSGRPGGGRGEVPERNSGEDAVTLAGSGEVASSPLRDPDDRPDIGSGTTGGRGPGAHIDSFLAGVELGAWRRYRHGESFLTALAGHRGARAAWQALPGEDWARRLAELAAVVVAGGRSAILMVPDQRDLDRVLRECEALVGDSAVGLSAGLGPAARYRRWLAVLRGTARVVVGTRSAVFAPAAELGLIAIWDDGDDTYAEPRSPYPHAREVAMLRAHDTGAAFVAAGFARTPEVQAVVESGWAHDLLADRATVRAASPRIGAPGDSDAALDRDPIARAVRIPGAAFAAARTALAAGEAVLVQVPRRGYVPALACTKCRTPARCRKCVGPLSLPEAGPADPAAQIAHSPVCRWCGHTEAAFRCPGCGGRVLRAVVIGAARTVEELGRAFPGVPIRGSSGAGLLDTVEPGPQVVVATVGAEPLLPGGYGVGLLLDGWALLGRADLRAAEDTLRRWLGAAALVKPAGRVLVMADPGIPTVQALLRWDPAGHAAAELAQRTEVGFPPAVRIAAIDGPPDAVAGLLAVTELPAAAEVLGPVPLPATARRPSGSGAGDDHGGPVEVERVLLRVPRRHGGALARALTAAQAVRSSQRAEYSARVQFDPLNIG
ncbi:hypothetical protein [Nocardia carnea]|uniref:primosomal protein N' family DNA-binding protein n=1 Tax=Nocardia carnea TaxID=37328 RepID=UPI0024548CEB|nr:hypothetical protein [Nocardia carnea]